MLCGTYFEILMMTVAVNPRISHAVINFRQKEARQQEMEHYSASPPPQQKQKTKTKKNNYPLSSKKYCSKLRRVSTAKVGKNIENRRMCIMKLRGQMCSPVPMALKTKAEHGIFF